MIYLIFNFFDITFLQYSSVLCRKITEEYLSYQDFLLQINLNDQENKIESLKEFFFIALQQIDTFTQNKGGR